MTLKQERLIQAYGNILQQNRPHFGVGGKAPELNEIEGDMRKSAFGVSRGAFLVFVRIKVSIEKIDNRDSIYLLDRKTLIC